MLGGGGGNAAATLTVQLTPEASPLVAHVNVSAATALSTAPLAMTGAGSYDPDAVFDTSIPLGYKWACATAAGGLCVGANSTSAPPSDRALYVMPANGLTPGDYVFTLTVRRHQSVCQSDSLPVSRGLSQLKPAASQPASQ